MHPFGARGCPRAPATRGLPLLVGPLFYSWPRDEPAQQRLGFGIEPLLRPLSTRGWEQTLGRANLILCATDPLACAIRREFPTAGVQTLPVIVEPSGAASDFPPRQPPTHACLRLAFVGNLVARKNPLVFCRCIHRLRLDGWNATGEVLGDGPLRGALVRLCDELGISGHVRMRGNMPNDQVPRAVAGAHFLISAAQGEPYGRAIVEAMAVGTPVVSHRSGGPRDIITDGVDGLLVDSLKPQAYTARIEASCAGDRWQSLSDAARRRAGNWRGEIVLPALEASLYEMRGARRACASVHG
jgi:glycosyltransferase involved in cell wall biosynthesis